MKPISKTALIQHLQLNINEKTDLYFFVSLISFILCIGFSYREITTILGYVFFLENDSNL